jgi:hypothetical protein
MTPYISARQQEDNEILVQQFQDKVGVFGWKW